MFRIYVWYFIFSAGTFVIEAEVECPLGYFPCGTLPICLHQTFQCNGDDDCGNNADEEDCDNVHGRPQSFDKYLPVVNGTDLRLSECSLPSYPLMCTCRRLTNLVCKDKNLTSIPDGIPSNITSLVLMDNRLSNIPVDAFSDFTQLHTLYLAENQIEVIQSGTFSQLQSLRWLFLNQNELGNLEDGIFEGLESLKWLELSSNNIENLSSDIFKPLQTLTQLELYANEIEVIDKETFEYLPSLEVLDLSRNRISKIDPGAFDDLSLTVLNLSSNALKGDLPQIFRRMESLENLDLSYNKILFQDDTFHGARNLYELMLNGIDIPNINSAMFENLTGLNIIRFKRFSYCKYAYNARSCFPKSDGISDEKNLLGKSILRAAVWTIALLTTVGNISVLISRLIMTTENRLHSIAVCNLCCADFIMGIYLFIIGVQDAYFRDQFHKYTLSWSESFTCHFAGFLAILSTEASILILTFISLERFFIVAFPYKHIRVGEREAFVVLGGIWGMALFLAAVPLLFPIWIGNFYGSNGVCFPLHIRDPKSHGWKYSALLFLGFNAVSFAVIIGCYLGMFKSITQTRKKSGSVKYAFRGDMSYAKRFFFIVLTDFLCWFPLAVLKVKALANIEIPNSMYAWLVIFILPINSALNPIIYTLSTEPFKVKFVKRLTVPLWAKRYSRRRQSSVTSDHGNAMVTARSTQTSFGKNSDVVVIT